MSNEKEWFNQGEWAEGISVKAHESVDVKEFHKQYQARPDVWKSVFQFLKQDLSALEVGKYPLAGDLAFAMVSEYQTKLPENAKWEAHKKYIDLQYVISGEEKMGVLPLEKVANPEEYNETKDLIFYGENEGDYFTATPEAFFLFFPTDVHRPSILVGESKPVKKVVVKIAVSA
ncbi:YhcH/YjgK/YiaL family protein [Gaoshiqia sediminis]|uniref:YhcH/YjgK/YiaL family protein n=1 Tax=Gaoshiqia sediminis TaxID=2986998 RepID=A0AA42CA30_9BACT|nr:YhcH/YjgK/YiaL family protein [Gaoshiqia sediminis]MCW0483227.1 YhcH/YjgK/YiaL family protein [Gaoshiqia sediminis]